MLRPDLPQENVDGEAVLWAVSRLRSSQKTKKFLIVLSDGAPVDDATLAANHLGILIAICATSSAR
jgi:cobaltochelatase CobT